MMKMVEWSVSISMSQNLLPNHRWENAEGRLITATQNGSLKRLEDSKSIRCCRSGIEFIS